MCVSADDGGTLGKGFDRTSPQLLHVFVEAVNDVPTFNLLPTLVVQQGAGLVVRQFSHEYILFET